MLASINLQLTCGGMPSLFASAGSDSGFDDGGEAEPGMMTSSSSSGDALQEGGGDADKQDCS